MLGVLGDLGGIFEITMIVFGFFLFPVSEHSFYLKASRLLYFARTKDQGLFNQNKDPELKDKLEKWLDTSKYTELTCSKVIQEI